MELSNEQLVVLQYILIAFDCVLVLLFSYFYVKACINIYNEIYKDRVKRFFLKLKTSRYETVSNENVLGQKRHQP